MNSTRETEKTEIKFSRSLRLLPKDFGAEKAPLSASDGRAYLDENHRRPGLPGVRRYDVPGFVLTASVRVLDQGTGVNVRETKFS